MASAAYSALVLEGELAQALARGEFVLHFQPQVRAARRRARRQRGADPLAPSARGLLPPDEFIPIAEQRRLMLPIGRWVLRRGGALRAALDAAACSTVRRSRSICRRMQFQPSDFVETVQQVLRDTGLAGERLELELTERMLMADLARSRQTLLQLQGARHAHLGRRLRHRLFVARPPEGAADRQDEDRPQLRQRPAGRARLGGDRRARSSRWRAASASR